MSNHDNISCVLDKASHTQQIQWYTHLEGLNANILKPGDTIRISKTSDQDRFEVEFSGELAEEMKRSTAANNSATQIMTRRGDQLYLTSSPDSKFTCVIKCMPNLNMLVGLFRLPFGGDSQSGGWG